jgi:anti-anti-sigma factor
LDSSAIGVLVGTRNRLTGDGGTLRFRNPHDVPRRVLELTGLGDWIDD